MTVRVTFTYVPDDPDDDDPTGVSEDEYNRTGDALMFQFGAQDITFEKATE